jgi:hypothetical protein
MSPERNASRVAKDLRAIYGAATHEDGQPVPRPRKPKNPSTPLLTFPRPGFPRSQRPCKPGSAASPTHTPASRSPPCLVRQRRRIPRRLRAHTGLSKAHPLLDLPRNPEKEHPLQTLQSTLQKQFVDFPAKPAGRYEDPTLHRPQTLAPQLRRRARRLQHRAATPVSACFLQYNGSSITTSRAKGTGRMQELDSLPVKGVQLY